MDCEWQLDEAAKLQRMAIRCLTEHDCRYDRSVLARENCGACVLNGYHATKDGPNYSGWARVYVQASKAIPRKWWDAFEAQLQDHDNPGYVSALKTDIATWGIHKAIV